tara:strand:+ start:432113 stop:434437 length:2325 start_codon:yes stop_codon:yes gene_type:complete
MVSAWFIIFALALLAFWPLVCAPGKILYSDHSDMLAMHVPMKHFLVHSFQQTGEIPNWCPSSFAGLPFIHDVQLAAFYPLHWPLYLLEPTWIGAAVSWLVVLHVIIAGCGMFIYARHTSLGWHGSLAAAGGWMFAGKWMMHMIDGGHSIMAPLAWLPWVLVCVHTAIESPNIRGRIRWATAAGLFFGMMILGTHPQVTFYSGLTIALSVLVWTLVGHEKKEPTIASLQRAKSLGKRLNLGIACGIWCALIAIGLGAIQLMPALEAAPQTSRASGVSPADILPGGQRVQRNFVGPAIMAIRPSGRWEDRGGFALVTVFLAVVAMISRRSEPWIRRHVWLCGILIAYAMGMAILFQWMPGFRLFRQATRMILVASLPMAWLAGAGVETLATWSDEPKRLRGIATRVVLIVATLCGGSAIRGWLQGETLLAHVYWLTLLITIPAMFWLIRASQSLTISTRMHAWTTLLIVDAVMLAVPSIDVRSFDEIYHTGSIVDGLKSVVQPGDRILEREASPHRTATPLGTGVPLALLHQLEPVRGYNSFDLASYRRYLKRIGGDDTQLRPLEDAWTFPLIGDFPIADQMRIDLLGVRYMIAPHDAELASQWRATPVAESAPTAYSLIDGGIETLPAYRVFKNHGAFPKAWTIDQRWVDHGSDAPIHLDRLLQAERSEVRPAKLRTYQPNRIDVQVDVSTPSLLVLADACFPGWKCNVDGQPKPIVPVEGLFRGVWIDPGAKEIQFLFQPDSLRYGRWITMLTLIGSVGILFVGNRRGFARETG